MEKREETNQKIRLTQFAKSAGCAAKIAPDILSQLVGKLPAFEDENLLVGVETSDDKVVSVINNYVVNINSKKIEICYSKMQGATGLIKAFGKEFYQLEEKN